MEPNNQNPQFTTQESVVSVLSNKFWLIIVVLSLLMILISGIYFNFKKALPVENISPITQTNVAKTVVPSGWLVYKNVDYGIELNYPKDYIIDEKDYLDGEEIIGHEINVYSTENHKQIQSETKETLTRPTVSISVWKTGDTLESVVDKLTRDFGQNFSPSTLNGKQAFETLDPAMGDSPYSIYVQGKNSIIKFSFDVNDIGPLDKARDALTQEQKEIIASIKF